MKVGKLVRRRREGMRISRQDMADAVDISVGVLAAWERALYRPPVNGLINLEKTLELPHGTLQTFYNDTDKRKIYVSHPLRSDKIGEALTAAAERNRKEVSEICRKILAEEKDVLILSPINAFGFLSTTPEEDELALDQCKALLELADELWVYGDWQHSEGCRAEIAYAEILKLPIKYKNRQTQD